MFENINENLEIIEYSYRKLKSYYFYNKSFIIMREKISKFENGDIESAFLKIEKFLSYPTSQDSIKFKNYLIKSVYFYVLPKRFKSNKSISENMTTNSYERNKDLDSVNFFIDFPIELMIIDTIFTIFIGKLTYENELISDDVYGNVLHNYELYGDLKNKSSYINFKSIKLFQRYFIKYSKWRNNAFQSLENNFLDGENSLLISMDIQAYFYNIRFNFDFSDSFNDKEMLNSIEHLINIVRLSYFEYFKKVKTLRRDLEDININSLPLPIGLFSSMHISNLYLTKFDKQIKEIKNCTYYGRYVDDLLMCFRVSKISDFNVDKILHDTFKNNSIFSFKNERINFKHFENLTIQKSKIKVLYIDANESRALIDLYNKEIKIIPSQVEVLPKYIMDIEDFDESTYSVENFGLNFKIREIGQMNFDAFKVSRYFSSLIRKQTGIDLTIETKLSVKNQINKITKFLNGNISIEYYTTWVNYLYFLALSENFKVIDNFIKSTLVNIKNINVALLDLNTYNNHVLIEKHLKKTLRKHLEISVASAFIINEPYKTKFRLKYFSLSKLLKDSNMFEHTLISLPLSNYARIENTVSYSKMKIDDYKVTLDDLNKSNKKVKFSPRFIHFEEIQLANFIRSIDDRKGFPDINDLKSIFEILNDVKVNFNIEKSSLVFNEYILETIKIPSNSDSLLEKVKSTVAVGNIKISKKDLIESISNKGFLTIEKKKNFRNLLEEAYCESNGILDFLVLPELFLPLLWVREVLEFARKSQIAISCGIQYIADYDKKIVRNFILTVIPFTYGNVDFRNTFLSIREKNDYSPLELVEVSKLGFRCENSFNPIYQIFNWRDIDFTSVLCYELTDIMVRSLLKGKCDLIILPVFNTDTTYFSNIIESLVRDLHVFIVQSNNSEFGDSRITGPYDRDNKDILRVKGGENSHVMIGLINFRGVALYQHNYYKNLEKTISLASNNVDIESIKRGTIEIKKLSARFRTKRVSDKLIRLGIIEEE